MINRKEIDTKIKNKIDEINRLENYIKKGVDKETRLCLSARIRFLQVCIRQLIDEKNTCLAKYKGIQIRNNVI